MHRRDRGTTGTTTAAVRDTPDLRPTTYSGGRADSSRLTRRTHSAADAVRWEHRISNPRKNTAVQQREQTVGKILLDMEFTDTPYHSEQHATPELHALARRTQEIFEGRRRTERIQRATSYLIVKTTPPILKVQTLVQRETELIIG
jgi:hypothetical protein